MTAQSPIVDRIRKLLELAKLSKNSNEHETAAAAAKAAELMAKYQIDSALIEAQQGEDANPEDVIEASLDGTLDLKQRVSWRVFIAAGVGIALGVETWTHAGVINGLGLASKMAAWQYMSKALANEVDRLADEAWSGPQAELARWNDVSVKRWKNAFRVGAARVIRDRLKKQAASSNESQQSDTFAAALDAGAVSEVATQALAIIKRDEVRVAEQYAKRSKNFVRDTPLGQTSCRDGYRAGQKAGASVNISGGGRGLPKPKSSLTD